MIKRSFTSSLDEEDRQVLEAWLDESERHRQLYEEMKRFVARRENFQLSVESKKRFKQDFELRIDKAYRRRGRRVWLKVVSCAIYLKKAGIEPLIIENNVRQLGRTSCFCQLRTACYVSEVK